MKLVQVSQALPQVWNYFEFLRRRRCGKLSDRIWTLWFQLCKNIYSKKNFHQNIFLHYSRKFCECLYSRTKYFFTFITSSTEKKWINKTDDLYKQLKSANSSNLCRNLEFSNYFYSKIIHNNCNWLRSRTILACLSEDHYILLVHHFYHNNSLTLILNGYTKWVPSFNRSFKLSNYL